VPLVQPGCYQHTTTDVSCKAARRTVSKGPREHAEASPRNPPNVLVNDPVHPRCNSRFSERQRVSAPTLVIVLPGKFQSGDALFSLISPDFSTFSAVLQAVLTFVVPTGSRRAHPGLSFGCEGTPGEEAIRQLLYPQKYCSHPVERPIRRSPGQDVTLGAIRSSCGDGPLAFGSPTGPGKIPEHVTSLTNHTPGMLPRGF